MKVAVLISGQIRDAGNCYQSILDNVITPHKADVFIDTWLPDNPIMDHRRNYLPNDMSADDLLRVYAPKLSRFEDFKTSPLMENISSMQVQNRSAFDGSWAHETIVPNIFYMHYKIWRCFELIKSYEYLNQVKYDAIIRLRFDLQFEKFPQIDSIKENTVYVPAGWDHRGGLNDLLAFGDRTSMEKYCSLFPALFEYANDGVGFHPESILRYHLLKQNLTIDRFQGTIYKLRGEYA